MGQESGRVPALHCDHFLCDVYQDREGRNWLVALVGLWWDGNEKNQALLAKLQRTTESGRVELRARQFVRWESEDDQLGAVERAFEYVCAELGYNPTQQANSLDLLAHAKRKARGS